MKKIRIIFTLLFLAAAVLACANPAGTPAPANVETIVAMTFQALTAAAPVVNGTPRPAANSLLPHSLYFRNNDKTGVVQVFRLDKDGKTLHQITFEPVAVENYDVSPADGSVAYISNNQLLWTDVNGAGRRLLVDGGPLDQSNRVTNTVSTPVWSPDGRTIAFGHDGLNFHTLATGIIDKALKNDFDTSQGFLNVKAIYSPLKYSPDGSRLLITISFVENGTMGIYTPAAKSLIWLKRSDGGLFCCNISWTPDSSGVYAASPTTGMILSGLLYANASSGAVNILLPESAPDGTHNYADAPLIGPDGKLYYFFNNLKDALSSHTPLYMVSSGTDGVTGRTQLRPDAFQNANEILWAPDASLAVVAYAPVQDVYDGGQAVIEYPDGRPAVVLADFALQMKWGP